MKLFSAVLVGILVCLLSRRTISFALMEKIDAHDIHLVGLQSPIVPCSDLFKSSFTIYLSTVLKTLGSLD